ncbi:MAG TPA: ABC transporter ATP-binding protein [Sedimentibacter sp.]|jgi:putative ABC transport system ATP-binding protein|nr:ABC transporter ATP-binding protein [Sedimentibacter sp.]HHZ00560.1 ABC transporter ATP-binding protein [Tissierellia bacterium]HOK49350.1 ABC transporter ATP-binding protein [Sedimentibacter sp.]HOW22645.1 ABC transporter ATP-binding protein [Sedimentibacter sp.]HRC81686.1 ABC transporter ATP-binding protein [Sedimentibacter sp.]
MGDILFRVQSLSKYYQMGEVTVKALEDVSFEVEKGEFIVILGPSGSGKSTLLNIIGGMDTPTRGSVVFNGEKITNFTDKELTMYRRYKIGFVFQFYNLIATLTARENVELVAEITRSTADIDEIMEAVGLYDRMDHFPSQMSGGEQQRVAIARAVAKNPQILLCDEPTGALDFETGINILKVLKDVNVKYKNTVMVITHNSPIAQMADRVIKMRSGTITEIIKNESPLAPERIVW